MLLQCRLALVFLTAFGQLLSAHSAAVAPRDVSQSISEGEGGPAGGATGAATTIEAPEYVRDLYNDMTNRSAPTDQRLYNTIRTFETTANEGCDKSTYKFKFDISAIMETELIHNSTLRVYLSLTEDTPGKNLEVSLLFLNNTKINTKTVETSTSQWLEFSVAPAINFWVRKNMHRSYWNDEFTGFKIQLTHNGNPANCDNRMKIKTETSGDYLPLLTVYSYETEESKSLFIQIVDEVMENAQVQQLINKRMVTRDAGDCKHCQKKTLTIQTALLNTAGKKTILGPSEIEINTCGGICQGPPIRSAHSSLLYVLHEKSYTDFNSQKYLKRCVPVEYNKIIVLIKNDDKNGEFILESVGNISVKECGCVYVHQTPSECT